MPSKRQPTTPSARSTSRGSNLVRVPRGRPSHADVTLITELAAHGLTVSAAQLERWRAAGLLPKPERRWLGRGAGSTSAYPPGAFRIAAQLSAVTGQGYTLHHAALALFVGGHHVDEAPLRAAFAW